MNSEAFPEGYDPSATSSVDDNLTIFLVLPNCTMHRMSLRSLLLMHAFGIVCVSRCVFLLCTLSCADDKMLGKLWILTITFVDGGKHVLH